jgi:hypothetical protein
MSTYDPSKPEDTGFLSEAPTELRNNFKGLKEDQIVDAALLKGLAPGNVNGQIPINNGVENENLNAGKLNNKTASDFAPKLHVHDTVTASSDGFMTATQNNKLANIAAGAEVNQNAFSNVLVGGVTIQADSKTDTLELVPGTNIALTPDATNDRIIIAVTGKVGSASAADTASTCTGNAATATTATSSTGSITGTISSTTQANFQGNQTTGIGTSTGDLGGIMVQNNGSSSAAAFMSFHRAGVYASYFGIDTDNQWAVGGWSAGANRRLLAFQDQIPASLPANGGTSDYCKYPHRLYRGGSDGEGENAYYVAPSWRNGQGWELKSYNGAGDEQTNIHRVIVGYADNAGSVPWSGVTGAPIISASFDAGHSFAANGYQKLANGLIMQWGQTVAGTSAVTFPIAYPTACASVVLTLHYGAQQDWTGIVYSFSNAGFNITGNTGMPNFWFSIGY